MVGNAVMIISWKRFHSSLLSVGALWKIHVCDMKYFQIFCRNAVSSSIKNLKSSFCSSKTISNAYSMEFLSNGRSYGLPILNFWLIQTAECILMIEDVCFHFSDATFSNWTDCYLQQQRILPMSLPSAENLCQSLVKVWVKARFEIRYQMPIKFYRSPSSIDIFAKTSKWNGKNM